MSKKSEEKRLRKVRLQKKAKMSANNPASRDLGEAKILLNTLEACAAMMSEGSVYKEQANAQIAMVKLKLKMTERFLQVY